MKLPAVRIVAGCVLLAAACSEASPSAAEEVAGELRALRMALAQQRHAVGSASSEMVDAQTALAPLRAALEALAASQRELAERQVALTQEMQRWSQLLVESVAGARADEAKAMAKRLGEFEARLKEQDSRHHEVEALLQGALERTADQLDAFLKRLETIAPVRRTDGGAVDALAPPGAGNAPGNASGNASGNSPSGTGAGVIDPAGNASAGGSTGGTGGIVGEWPPRSSSIDGLFRGRASASRWWWLGLSGLGLGVATLCLRRSRRSRPKAREKTVPMPAFADVLPVAGERSVEEIWAAAALLGEAVGRLRQQVGGPDAAQLAAAALAGGENAAPAPGAAAPEPAVRPAAPVHPHASPISPAGPPPPPATDSLAPATAAACEPAPSGASAGDAPGAPTTPEGAHWPLETVVAVLPGGAMDRDVLAALASERSVLRRPAPVLTGRGAVVEVRFHVVPGTTPADRVRLLQRLRDGLRAGGSSSR